MYVLVAPAAFKGTLSAREAAVAMAKALSTQAFPDAVAPTVDSAPLADGGGGTLDALAEPLGLVVRTCTVRAPDGRPVEARWGLTPGGARAVIESAQAVGLALVPQERRDPRALRSWGLGELVRAAVDAGARELWIGLGDTGVVDGGRGMRDTLAGVDLAGVSLVGLVDVDAPLAGPSGARRFMKQKGARDEDLDALERELCAMHPRFVDVPGAGAAGGLGAAILALGGVLRRGADVVAEAIDLDARVARADVVVTGEGRLDEQTLQGKAIARLARACRAHAKRLVVVCGTCALDDATLRAHGVALALPLVRPGVSLDDVLADPASHVTSVCCDPRVLDAH